VAPTSCLPAFLLALDAQNGVKAALSGRCCRLPAGNFVRREHRFGCEVIGSAKARVGPATKARMQARLPWLSAAYLPFLPSVVCFVLS
jgi:hypothetical protein